MRAIKMSSMLALGFLAVSAGSARAADVMNVTVPFAFVVGNHSFPAGRYVLQVTAIDRIARASTSQRVNFTID